MINNRQNGRRRGRGGGPRSPNQTPSPGNRQDNRSRGNAAQLLEKYKSLARDAQLQGDRVQAEYWMQFAEHYYRVLNESRARFEEQRPRPREDYMSEDEEDQDDGIAADGEEGDEQDERDERPRAQERNDRQGNDRQERDRPDRDRQERGERPERQRAERPDRNERPRREYRDDRNGERRPERAAAPRYADQPQDRDDGPSDERISLEVLPPAISVIDGDAPAKAPRRRARRPRGDGEEIAPAA